MSLAALYESVLLEAESYLERVRLEHLRRRTAPFPACFAFKAQGKEMALARLAELLTQQRGVCEKGNYVFYGTFPETRLRLPREHVAAFQQARWVEPGIGIEAGATAEDASQRYTFLARIPDRQTDLLGVIFHFVAYLNRQFTWASRLSWRVHPLTASILIVSEEKNHHSFAPIQSNPWVQHHWLHHLWQQDQTLMGCAARAVGSLRRSTSDPTGLPEDVDVLVRQALWLCPMRDFLDRGKRAHPTGPEISNGEIVTFMGC